MRALVTGATGLLGSHIVDSLLERGDDVRALARPASDVSYLRHRDVPIVEGDVTDEESIGAAADGIDVVYHAAAKVTDWGPWSDFEAVTIGGTRNALEAASAAGVSRFLHVSTDSVYPNGPKRRGEILTEDAPLVERPPSWDPYQRSKLAAERLAWQYHYWERLAVTIVRPGLILGERDRSIMPGFVDYVGSDRAVYVGRGVNREPCIYAGDAAEACVLAATQDAGIGRAYNLASEVLTQRELFAAIAEALGVEPPTRSVPYWIVYLYGAASEILAGLGRRNERPTMTRMSANLIAADYILDSSRAERELGWKAKVPVREAIRRSVAWIRDKQPQPVGSC